MQFKMISTLLAAERFTEAVQQCDDALVRNADVSELHVHRGTALKALGRNDEAIAALCRAVALRPKDSALLCALGELHVLSANNDRGEELFSRAVALDPTDLRSYLGLAECRLRHRSFAQLWDEATTILPPGGAPRLLLEASVLYLCHSGRYSEAYIAANLLRGMPDGGPEALLALARIAEESEHDYLGARTHLAGALQAFPDRPGCHLAHIALLAKIGAWEEAAFAARAMVRHFGGAYPRFEGGGPTWDGAPVAGKTVLLDSSIARGYGDSLHFCRFAAALKERGATVGIRARKGLECLLATVPGVDFVIASSEPVANVDYVCEMSLAWLFLDLPATGVALHHPYLQPTTDVSVEWRARIPRRKALSVGIAWLSADRRTTNRHTAKNVPVSQLTPFARLDGVQFASLLPTTVSDQLRGVFGKEMVAQFGPHLTDFMQTAALVSQLDVVVTVDTAVAHLAGALDKPTLLLLPFSAEWRWMVDRRDSPWYPSMRLIRQAAPGEWAAVIDECARALQELADSLPRLP